jgi:hypothetical protein
MKKQYDGPTRQEKVEAAHKQLVTQLEAMVTSEDWTSFLKIAAKFRKYSANNCMLIHWQRPDAERVASFGTWKSLKRSVKKGEKAISIIGPCRVKISEDDEDPVYAIRGFKVVSVFDITQTDGEPLDDGNLTTILESGAPEGMWDSMVTLADNAGYTVSYGDTGKANGSTDHTTKHITISAMLSDGAAVKTLVHELAHTRQSNTKREYVTRDIREVEAESVAFIVCQAYGLASAPYSIGYVAGWAKGDIEIVRKTADWVVKTAHAIIDEAGLIGDEEAKLDEREPVLA